MCERANTVMTGRSGTTNPQNDDDPRTFKVAYVVSRAHISNDNAKQSVFVREFYYENYKVVKNVQSLTRTLRFLNQFRRSWPRKNKSSRSLSNSIDLSIPKVSLLIILAPSWMAKKNY